MGMCQPGKPRCLALRCRDCKSTRIFWHVNPEHVVRVRTEITTGHGIKTGNGATCDEVDLASASSGGSRRTRKRGRFATRRPAAWICSHGAPRVGEPLLLCLVDRWPRNKETAYRAYSNPLQHGVCRYSR